MTHNTPVFPEACSPGSPAEGSSPAQHLSECLVSRNPLHGHFLLDLSTVISVWILHWAGTSKLKCEGGFSFLINKPQGPELSFHLLDLMVCFPRMFRLK